MANKSTLLHTYEIKVNAEIAEATKKINELQKNMTDKVEFSEQFTSQIDEIKDSLSALSEDAKKQFKEIKSSIKDISSEGLETALKDTFSSITNSLEGMTVQVEAFSTALDNTDAGKFEKFITSLAAPLKDLTVEVRNATDAIKSLVNSGITASSKSTTASVIAPVVENTKKDIKSIDVLTKEYKTKMQQMRKSMEKETRRGVSPLTLLGEATKKGGSSKAFDFYKQENDLVLAANVDILKEVHKISKEYEKAGVEVNDIFEEIFKNSLKLRGKDASGTSVEKQYDATLGLVDRFLDSYNDYSKENTGKGIKKVLNLQWDVNIDEDATEDQIKKELDNIENVINVAIQDKLDNNSKYQLKIPITVKNEDAVKDLVRQTKDIIKQFTEQPDAPMLDIKINPVLPNGESIENLLTNFGKEINKDGAITLNKGDTVTNIDTTGLATEDTLSKIYEAITGIKNKGVPSNNLEATSSGKPAEAPDKYNTLDIYRGLERAGLKISAKGLNTSREMIMARNNGESFKTVNAFASVAEELHDLGLSLKGNDFTMDAVKKSKLWEAVDENGKEITDEMAKNMYSKFFRTIEGFVGGTSGRRYQKGDVVLLSDLRDMLTNTFNSKMFKETSKNRYEEFRNKPENADKGFIPIKVLEKYIESFIKHEGEMAAPNGYAFVKGKIDSAGNFMSDAELKKERALAKKENRPFSFKGKTYYKTLARSQTPMNEDEVVSSTKEKLKATLQDDSARLAAIKLNINQLEEEKKLLLDITELSKDLNNEDNKASILEKGERLRKLTQDVSDIGEFNALSEAKYMVEEYNKVSYFKSQSKKQDKIDKFSNRMTELENLFKANFGEDIPKTKEAVDDFYENIDKKMSTLLVDIGDSVEDIVTYANKQLTVNEGTQISRIDLSLNELKDQEKGAYRIARQKKAFMLGNDLVSGLSSGERSQITTELQKKNPNIKDFKPSQIAVYMMKDSVYEEKKKEFEELKDRVSLLNKLSLQNENNKTVYKSNETKASYGTDVNSEIYGTTPYESKLVVSMKNRMDYLKKQLQSYEELNAEIDESVSDTIKIVKPSIQQITTFSKEFKGLNQASRELANFAEVFGKGNQSGSLLSEADAVKNLSNEELDNIKSSVAYLKAETKDHQLDREKMIISSMEELSRASIDEVNLLYSSLSEIAEKGNVAGTQANKDKLYNLRNAFLSSQYRLGEGEIDTWVKDAYIGEDHFNQLKKELQEASTKRFEAMKNTGDEASKLIIEDAKNTEKKIIDIFKYIYGFNNTTLDDIVNTTLKKEANKGNQGAIDSLKNLGFEDGVYDATKANDVLNDIRVKANNDVDKIIASIISKIDSKLLKKYVGTYLSPSDDSAETKRTKKDRLKESLMHDETYKQRLNDAENRIDEIRTNYQNESASLKSELDQLIKALGVEYAEGDSTLAEYEKRTDEATENYNKLIDEKKDTADREIAEIQREIDKFSNLKYYNINPKYLTKDLYETNKEILGKTADDEINHRNEIISRADKAIEDEITQRKIAAEEAKKAAKEGKKQEEKTEEATRNIDEEIKVQKKIVEAKKKELNKLNSSNNNSRSLDAISKDIENVYMQSPLYELLKSDFKNIQKNPSSKDEITKEIKKSFFGSPIEFKINTLDIGSGFDEEYLEKYEDAQYAIKYSNVPSELPGLTDMTKLQTAIARQNGLLTKISSSKGSSYYITDMDALHKLMSRDKYDDNGKLIKKYSIVDESKDFLEQANKDAAKKLLKMVDEWNGINDKLNVMNVKNEYGWTNAQIGYAKEAGYKLIKEGKDIDGRQRNKFIQQWNDTFEADYIRTVEESYENLNKIVGRINNILKGSSYSNLGFTAEEIIKNPEIIKKGISKRTIPLGNGDFREEYTITPKSIEEPYINTEKGDLTISQKYITLATEKYQAAAQGLKEEFEIASKRQNEKKILEENLKIEEGKLIALKNEKKTIEENAKLTEEQKKANKKKSEEQRVENITKSVEEKRKSQEEANKEFLDRFDSKIIEPINKVKHEKTEEEKIASNFAKGRYYVGMSQEQADASHEIVELFSKIRQAEKEENKLVAEALRNELHAKQKDATKLGLKINQGGYAYLEGAKTHDWFVNPYDYANDNSYTYSALYDREGNPLNNVEYETKGLATEAMQQKILDAIGEGGTGSGKAEKDYELSKEQYTRKREIYKAIGRGNFSGLTAAKVKELQKQFPDIFDFYSLNKNKKNKNKFDLISKTGNFYKKNINVYDDFTNKKIKEWKLDVKSNILASDDDSKSNTSPKKEKDPNDPRDDAFWKEYNKIEKEMVEAKEVETKIREYKDKNGKKKKVTNLKAGEYLKVYERMKKNGYQADWDKISEYIEQRNASKKANIPAKESPYSEAEEIIRKSISDYIKKGGSFTGITEERIKDILLNNPEFSKYYAVRQNKKGKYIIASKTGDSYNDNKKLYDDFTSELMNKLGIKVKDSGQSENSNNSERQTKANPEGDADKIATLLSKINTNKSNGLFSQSKENIKNIQNLLKYIDENEDDYTLPDFAKRNGISEANLKILQSEMLNLDKENYFDNVFSKIKLTPKTGAISSAKSNLENVEQLFNVFAAINHQLGTSYTLKDFGEKFGIAVGRVKELNEYLSGVIEIAEASLGGELTESIKAKKALIFNDPTSESVPQEKEAKQETVKKNTSKTKTETKKQSIKKILANIIKNPLRTKPKDEQKNKFAEYSLDVAFGKDRYEYAKKLYKLGYGGGLLREPLHGLGLEDIKSTGSYDQQKANDAILKKLGIKSKELTQIIEGIADATGGYFKSTSRGSADKDGWIRFKTYSGTNVDSNGKVHSDLSNTDMDNIYKADFKVYAQLENVANLNKDFISEVLEALSLAGFKGSLKTIKDSSEVYSTDQVVIHGSTVKDQEIAYNVLRNQFASKLSYLGAGFDPKMYKDGKKSYHDSFTQLLSNGLEKNSDNNNHIYNAWAETLLYYYSNIFKDFPQIAGSVLNDYLTNGLNHQADLSEFLNQSSSLKSELSNKLPKNSNIFDEYDLLEKEVYKKIEEDEMTVEDAINKMKTFVSSDMIQRTIIRNSQSSDNGLSSNATEPLAQEFEDLSNGGKRVLSDIGLTYDELLEKIKKENKEVAKGNAEFKERLTYIKAGIVVDSIMGDGKSTKNTDNKTLDYDKLIHTHSPLSNTGGRFSSEDIDNFISQLMLNKAKELELIWGNESLNLNLSGINKDRADLFSDLYYDIMQLVYAKFGSLDETGNVAKKLPTDIEQKVSDYVNDLISGILVRDFNSSLKMTNPNFIISENEAQTDLSILAQMQQKMEEIRNSNTSEVEKAQEWGKYLVDIYNIYHSISNASQPNKNELISGGIQHEELSDLEKFVQLFAELSSTISKYEEINRKGLDDFKYDPTEAKSVSKIFEDIQNGALIATDNISELLKKLGILSDEGKIIGDIITNNNSGNSLGGIISNKYTVIARELNNRTLNDKEFSQNNSSKIISAGGQIANIVGYIEDSTNNILYDIQQTVSGTPLSELKESAQVTDEQLKSLLTTVDAIIKSGGDIDDNLNNFIYDPQKGFTAIDIAADTGIGFTPEQYAKSIAIMLRDVSQDLEKRFENIISNYDFSKTIDSLISSYSENSQPNEIDNRFSSDVENSKLLEANLENVLKLFLEIDEAIVKETGSFEKLLERSFEWNSETGEHSSFLYTGNHGNTHPQYRNEGLVGKVNTGLHTHPENYVRLSSSDITNRNGDLMSFYQQWKDGITTQFVRGLKETLQFDADQFYSDLSSINPNAIYIEEINQAISSNQKYFQEKNQNIKKFIGKLKLSKDSYLNFVDKIATDSELLSKIFGDQSGNINFNSANLISEIKKNVSLMDNNINSIADYLKNFSTIEILPSMFDETEIKKSIIRLATNLGSAISKEEISTGTTDYETQARIIREPVIAKSEEEAFEYVLQNFVKNGKHYSDYVKRYDNTTFDSQIWSNFIPNKSDNGFLSDGTTASSIEAQADAHKDNGDTFPKEYAEAFVKGLKASTPEMEKAFELFSQAGIEVVKKYYDINSPSETMRKLGLFVGQGFEEGIMESLDDLKKVMMDKLKEGTVTEDELEELIGWDAIDEETGAKLDRRKKPYKNLQNVAKLLVESGAYSDMEPKELINAKSDLTNKINNTSDVKELKELNHQLELVEAAYERIIALKRNEVIVEEEANGAVEQNIESEKELSEVLDTMFNMNGKESILQLIEALGGDVNISKRVTTNKKNGNKITSYNLKGQYGNAVVSPNGLILGENVLQYDALNRRRSMNKLQDDLTNPKNSIPKQILNILNRPNTYTASYLKEVDDLLKDISNLDFSNLNNLTDVENLKNNAELILSERVNPSNKKGNVNRLYSDISLANKAIEGGVALRYRNDYKKIADDMSRLAEKSDISAEEVNNLHTQFMKLNAEASTSGRSFFGQITKRLSDMNAKFIATYFSIQDFVRYIRTAISTITELDTALTEMRKVSDENLKSLKEYQMTTFDTASAIGTTAVQLQQSTADWMRLGESLDEAAESAKEATILMNVSEFDNINDATTSLVAMSQAYKDLSKGEIIDVLNNVGNNFSISTSELSTALQSSAATLMTQGNDLNEAVALITAGNSVVQDADKVGTGIRTISLRIAGTEEAKAQLAELDEDVEDYVVQTSAKKRQIIMDYTAVASNLGQGVDILDSNGNLKNTYEILLEISKVYKEIQEEDKKYGTNRAQGLVEELAGKNRSNIAASILMNPDLLENVYESAQNSAGSAEEELSKYLDSIVGRTQQFKNELQEIMSNIIDSETIKNIVLFGTTILDVLSEIKPLVPILASLALGIAATKTETVEFFKYSKKDGKIFSPLLNDIKSIKPAIDSLLKKNNLSKIFEGIGDEEKSSVEDLLKNVFSNDAFKAVAEESDDLGAVFDTVTEEVDGFSDSVKETARNLVTNGVTSMEEYEAAENGVTIASKAATIATELFNSVLSAGITIIASYTLNKLIEWFNDFTHAEENAKNAANSFMSEYESMSKEFKDNAKTLDELSERYYELSDGVDSFGNNLRLSSDQFKEYNEICNQIADIFPELITGWTDSGDAIIDVTNKVNGLSDAYKEARKQQLSELVSGGDGDKEDYSPDDVLSNFNNNYAQSGWGKFLGWYMRTGAPGQSPLPFLKAPSLNTKSYTYDELEDIYNDVISMSLEEFKDKYYPYNGDELTLTGDKKYYRSLIEELFGFDKTNIDELFSGAKTQAIAELNVLNSGLDSSKNKVIELASAYYELNKNYDDLTDTQKSIVENIIKNIDNETIYNFDGSSAELSAWVSDVVSLIQGAEPDVQFAIKQLFAIDEKTMSVANAKETVDIYIEQLKNALNNGDITEEQYNLIISGLDTDKYTEKYNELQNSLKKLARGNIADLNMLQAYTKDFNMEQVDNWLEKMEEVIGYEKQAKDALQEYIDLLNKEKIQTAFTDVDKFATAFNSKEYEKLKNYLTGLSKVGKLDDETLSSNREFNKLLYDLGINASKDSEEFKQLAQYIQDVADAASLNSIKTYGDDLKSLSDSYVSFTQGKRITIEQLESLENSFGELDSYEAFEDAVMSGEKKLQPYFNDMATEILIRDDALKNLTESTKSYYIEELKSIGITNAEEVVNTVLTNKEKERAKVLEELVRYNEEVADSEAVRITNAEQLENATDNELKKMALEADEAGIAAGAIAEYALKKMIANNTLFSEENNIEQIIELARIAGIGTQALYDLAQAQATVDRLNTLKSLSTGNTAAYIATSEALKSAEKDLEEQKNNFALNLEKIFNGEYYTGVNVKSKLDEIGDAAKDALDKLLKLFDAELAAGVITFQQYVDKSRKAIEDYYKAGKITAQEYYDYLSELYNKQVSEYDKVISAVQRLISEEIDKLNKQKETIEKNYNEQIEKIREKIESIQEENEEIDKNMELQKAQYVIMLLVGVIQHETSNYIG